MDEEGAGGSYHSSMERKSTKRNFSTMSASHNDQESFAPIDDHYINEHSSRRRRLDSSSPDLSTDRARARIRHYPGDGLDFRRPVMSSSANPRDRSTGMSRRLPEEDVNENSGTQTTVIDLTEEDGTEHSPASGRQPTTSAHASDDIASRAQRLPRFGRNVINVEEGSFEADEDREAEEEFTTTSHLPGAHYLALPPGRGLPDAFARVPRRPQFSGLRRPTRPPSPPINMDRDEVEFVTARPASPVRSFASRQPTPTRPPSMNTRPRIRPRSVTPYPTGVQNDTIDLTADDDDDVVLLDTRQTAGNNTNNGGPNVAPPVNVDGRDYGQFGHVANLLRAGGNMTNRLMERLQGLMPGLEGELRAEQQAADHFQYNHRPAHRQPHRHHHHHHGHARAAVDRLGRHGHAGAHFRLGGGPAGGLPIRMDYDLTGFDLGLAGANGPPTPKYSPPPAPGEGFTRSPEEDEVVVCPNCGDELAVGEGETKQEVWVIKSCGHAYCGECAQNRGKSSASKKGKGKAPVYVGTSTTPPFKKCVVEDCGKPAAAKSMIRIYLGT